MNQFQPIHWILIPGGAVQLATGGYLPQPTIFQTAPFAISKYPVTNAQFATFIEADGYQQSNLWSSVGWEAKEKAGWTEPRYWRNVDWNTPEQPIVGVSWFEAQAFCNWLSSLNGKSITLPSEQQWQRAAQGEDGRFYPWGNVEPQAELCNWNRLIDETTPVTCYPKGASPFGVFDLCGNVWEWCATGWESGTAVSGSREPRLLRGGSWSSDSPLSLRVTNRSPKDPNTRLNPAARNNVTVGFRLVFDE